jgi:hypothetical protein
MRVLPLVLALGLAAPQKSRARTRSDEALPPPEPPSSKQSRRRADRVEPRPTESSQSPCGRHRVAIDGGVLYVDGRRVHRGVVHILAAPTWRPDGDAVAWLERAGGETRLAVLPALSSDGELMAWPLPRALGHERVHWAGKRRVVVGPAPLAPLAVASWSDG